MVTTVKAESPKPARALLERMETAPESLVADEEEALSLIPEGLDPSVISHISSAVFKLRLARVLT